MSQLCHMHLRLRTLTQRTLLQYTIEQDKDKAARVFLMKPIIDGNTVIIVIATMKMLWDCVCFGHRRVLIMDATHGTNVYSYHLLTVLVIGANNAGRPVMWAITSHKDANSVAIPLRALQDAARQLLPGWAPQTIMTDKDMAEQAAIRYVCCHRGLPELRMEVYHQGIRCEGCIVQCCIVVPLMHS